MTKKKRTSVCNDCGKKIKKDDKFCTSCGAQIIQKLSKVSDIKSKSSGKKIFWVKFFYSIWLITLISFMIMTALDTDSTSDYIGYTVIVGAVSFLFLVFSLHSNEKHKQSRQYTLGILLTLIGFFLLMAVGVFASFNNNKYKNTNGGSLTNYADIKPLVTPTIKPIQKPFKAQNIKKVNQIDCAGPDGVVFKTTKVKCDEFNSAWGNEPTPDPNEIIKCNIHANCGGGYKEMTRETCDQIVCCTVDFNNTMKLISKDQCNREQKQNETKSWTEFCNNMCSGYNSDMCSNYYEVGTTGMSNCIMDTNDQKNNCLMNCHNDQ